MGFAVIFWQLLIFASIYASGRWRKAVIVFWVIWTIAQVFAFWLSALQFMTIALAAVAASGRSSQAPAPPAATLPAREQRRFAVATSLSLATPSTSTADSGPATTLDAAIHFTRNVDVVQRRTGLTAQDAPYITRATFVALSRQRLAPDEQSADANTVNLVVDTRLSAFFNRIELQEMAVFKAMTLGGGGLKILPIPDSERYIFRIGNPRYHYSKDCEYLHSAFENYLVPPEIAHLGPAQVDEFRRFCKANRELLDKSGEHVFWAHVGAHFGVKVTPKPIKRPNSGVMRMDSRSMIDLESAVSVACHALTQAIDHPIYGGVVKRLRYAAGQSALRTALEPDQKKFMESFYKQKRELAELVLDLYRLEAGLDHYQLPIELLRRLGLEPCRGCG